MLRLANGARPHELSFSARFPCPFLAPPFGFNAVEGWPGRFIRPVRCFIRLRPPATLLCSFALRLVFLTTTISADFSSPTAAIADDGAPRRDGTPVDEISPGKNTVLRHSTASFTSVAERRNFAVLPRARHSSLERRRVPAHSTTSASYEVLVHPPSPRLRRDESADDCPIAFLPTVGRPSAVGFW